VCVCVYVDIYVRVQLVNDKRKLALEVQTLKEEKDRAETREFFFNFYTYGIHRNTYIYICIC